MRMRKSLSFTTYLWYGGSFCVISFTNVEQCPYDMKVFGYIRVLAFRTYRHANYIRTEVYTNYTHCLSRYQY